MTKPTLPRRLVNIFITGTLAALPLGATLLILVWGARLVANHLGPGSLVGSIVRSIGLGIVSSEAIAYLIGVGIVLLAIFVLGVVVQTRLRSVLTAMIDGVMGRIPVVRGVYSTLTKFVDLLGQRDENSVRSMHPVWLHFGGVGGVAVLGLLSTPDTVRIGEREYFAVLVPTAPVPVGGGLLYAPRDWVTKAEIGVDGLTSIYVSMGITSSQYLTPGVSSGAAPRTPAERR